MEHERRGIDTQVAILETKLNQLVAEVSEVKTAFSTHIVEEKAWQLLLTEKIEANTEATIALKMQLTKYLGYISGIAAAFAFIGVLWVATKDWVFTHFNFK